MDAVACKLVKQPERTGSCSNRGELEYFLRSDGVHFLVVITNEQHEHMTKSQIWRMGETSTFMSP